MTEDTRRIAELEEELEQARERIESLERTVESLRDSKGDFLAVMNHELRTPLNHIVGFSDVILMGMAGELNDEQRTQLSMISRSGRYLLSIVNDVQDLTKFDAGTLVIQDNIFPAEEVVEGAIEMCRLAAVEKGLFLVGEIPETGIIARSDRRRVRQILVNLINNAVKFTPRGGVTVRATRDGARVRFEVVDTGYGMSPEEMGAVFDEFVQLPPRTADLAKSPGTGLGLAISRRLAALLGGSIGATSEPDVGSVFSFEVPADADTQEVGTE
ncbi:MAG: HAMP domain-containing sensor histidine kinase [Coriobacteriia bacterium]|nr:HAMP domain-containing sensor histidine kinase [Coriobacteriia bacterium]